MWRGMLILIALTLLLSGCYGPVSTTSGVGIGESSSDFIIVEMWASTSCAQPGDTVHLRATATNTSNRVTWTVDMKDEPVFDITAPIRWSAGKPLTPDLTHLELKPGESKSIEMDYVVPKRLSGIVFAQAQFYYMATSPGGPVRPGVTIHVLECYGPIGP
jgi:hypothetical protein